MTLTIIKDRRAKRLPACRDPVGLHAWQAIDTETNSAARLYKNLSQYHKSR